MNVRALLNFSRRLFYIVGIIIVVSCMFTIRFAIVSGNSMYPTYKDNDLLLVFHTKDIARNDIVAIYSDDLKEILCKRVIGLEGDTITMNDGLISVNGTVLKEDYVNEKDWVANYNACHLNDGLTSIDSNRDTVQVNEGYIYVLGDNRNHSTDSRWFGGLEKSSVYGKCIVDITKYTGIHLSNIRFVLKCAFVCVLLLCLRSFLMQSKRVTF